MPFTSTVPPGNVQINSAGNHCELDFLACLKRWVLLLCLFGRVLFRLFQKNTHRPGCQVTIRMRTRKNESLGDQK